MILANAKLALFYDWLAYNPELDNIMNIGQCWQSVLIVHVYMYMYVYILHEETVLWGQTSQQSPDIMVLSLLAFIGREYT